MISSVKQTCRYFQRWLVREKNTRRKKSICANGNFSSWNNKADHEKNSPVFFSLCKRRTLGWSIRREWAVSFWCRLLSFVFSMIAPARDRRVSLLILGDISVEQEKNNERKCAYFEVYISIWWAHFSCHSCSIWSKVFLCLNNLRRHSHVVNSVRHIVMHVVRWFQLDNDDTLLYWNIKKKRQFIINQSKWPDKIEVCLLSFIHLGHKLEWMTRWKLIWNSSTWICLFKTHRNRNIAIINIIKLMIITTVTITLIWVFDNAERKKKTWDEHFVRFHSYRSNLDWD